MSAYSWQSYLDDRRAALLARYNDPAWRKRLAEYMEAKRQVRIARLVAACIKNDGAPAFSAWAKHVKRQKAGIARQVAYRVRWMESKHAELGETTKFWKPRNVSAGCRKFKASDTPAAIQSDGVAFEMLAA